MDNIKPRRLSYKVIQRWSQDHQESYLLALIGITDEGYDDWEEGRISRRVSSNR